MGIKLSKIKFNYMEDLIHYASENRLYMKKNDKMYVDFCVAISYGGIHFVCLDNSPNEYINVMKFYHEKQTFYKLV